MLSPLILQRGPLRTGPKAFPKRLTHQIWFSGDVLVYEGPEHKAQAPKTDTKHALSPYTYHICYSRSGTTSTSCTLDTCAEWHTCVWQSCELACWWSRWQNRPVLLCYVSCRLGNGILLRLNRTSVQPRRCFWISVWRRDFSKLKTKNNWSEQNERTLHQWKWN